MHVIENNYVCGDVAYEKNILSNIDVYDPLILTQIIYNIHHHHTFGDYVVHSKLQVTVTKNNNWIQNQFCLRLILCYDFYDLQNTN